MDAKEAEETWRWSTLQETGHITDIVRSSRSGITAATPDYLNALQQQLADLKAERDSLDEERRLLQRLFDDRHARWKATEAERDRYREAMITATVRYHRHNHLSPDDWTKCHFAPCEYNARLISPSPIAPGEAQG